jgi:hypothetical protein
MIFRPSSGPGPTPDLASWGYGLVLPPAADFLPSGHATVASAVLLGAIHSATHGVELQEGVNFFSSTMLLDWIVGEATDDAGISVTPAPELAQRPTVLLL